MPKFGISHRGGAFSALFGAAAAALLACLSRVDLVSTSPSVALAQTATVLGGDLQMPEQKIPLNTVSAPLPAPYETGVASTYGEGDGFEGKRTACGQVFHTRVVQVAHKSLPCGTMIRVEDSDTRRSVVAEVTDRGPYIPGRIVDLSWGAFRQLQPSAPGLLNVTVYLLDN
jgi:rare lipoprotein A